MSILPTTLLRSNPQVINFFLQKIKIKKFTRTLRIYSTQSFYSSYTFAKLNNEFGYGKVSIVSALALIAAAAIIGVASPKFKDTTVKIEQGNATVDVSVDTAQTTSPTPLSTPNPSQTPHSSASVEVKSEVKGNSVHTQNTQNKNSTHVEVNGKVIQPDANGNVHYKSSDGSSDVSVEVNNTVNTQSSSSVRTENNVTVSVQND